MTELLHLSALLPAAFGVCCTVGGRRRGRLSVGFDGIAALAMLIAMTDATLRLNLIAPILWVAGLVALALAGVPLARRVVTPASSGVDAHASLAHRAALHTSLGLIVMAGLLALMSTGHVTAASSHHSAGSMLSALVLGGSAVYAGYSTWRAVALFRLPRRNLVGCLEAASMAASVALMAGALAV
jgi:hypothetical protein